jgi:hypothetical protein
MKQTAIVATLLKDSTASFQLTIEFLLLLLNKSPIHFRKHTYLLIAHYQQPVFEFLIVIEMD